MFNLKVAHENFSKINLVKFDELAQGLAQNKADFINFVRNPDDFLRQRMDKSEISESLHCHVVVEGEASPPEIIDTAQSIVFSTGIHVNPQWRNDTLTALRATAAEPTPTPEPKPDKPEKPSPTPVPERPGCSGCGECIKLFIAFGA